MHKLLVPSSALLWGLQLAFLSPSLALILVNLYGATTGEVGWVLGIYNVGGFIASLLLPAYADKKSDYLGPMLACGALTVVLAVVLGFATTLPIATVALVVIGGPAGVGSSLLFAHLRHSGSRPADVISTRAIISVAWVAGPPVATFIMGSFGNRAMLLAIAEVAGLNVAATAMMIKSRVAAVRANEAAGDDARRAAMSAAPSVSRLAIVLITAAFVLLQATNATAVTVMTIYVTDTLRMDVMWAGIALGVAAALEVPALLLVGRLTGRFTQLGLIISSCLAGLGYYLGLSAATGPLPLLALQLLNAWSFAGISGVGLPLFQQMIPRPGLSTGLYMNTRRIGAIVSGPIIAVGSLTAMGQRGIFLSSAALTLVGLTIIVVANRVKPFEPRRSATSAEVH